MNKLHHLSQMYAQRLAKVVKKADDGINEENPVTTNLVHLRPKHLPNPDAAEQMPMWVPPS